MSTIRVLCYNCGIVNEVSFDTPHISQACRKCKIKDTIKQVIEEDGDLLDRLID